MNSHELYVSANNLLTNLLNNSTMMWRQGIGELYLDNPDTTATAIKNIITYAIKENCVNPECGIRFVEGSLAILSNEHLPNLLPSEQNKVFAILAEKKRIKQIGAGRGKGLVIFNHSYIEEELNDTYTNFIDPDDSKALVQALRDTFSDQTSDIKALKTTVDELKKIIASQHQKISTLESQVHTQYQRSWT